MTVAYDKIYAHLQDDESRELFRCRYAYYESGDQNHLMDELRISCCFNKTRMNELGGTEKDIWELLEQNDLKRRGVVLYGAGANANHCINLLCEHQIKIRAIYDSATEKHGKTLGEYQIASPERILVECGDSPIIITTSLRRHKDEIRDFLTGNEISEERIFFYHVWAEKQYFGPAFLTALPGEVYVDGGCYDGETVLDFVEFAEKGVQQIYAFEPDPDCYARTVKTLQNHGIENTALFQKGLSDKAEKRKFDRTWLDLAGSRISDTGADMIETVCIDETVHEKVTFIKMDIEGAEFAALKGAKRTIIEYMPRLTICVYHKPEDIMEIPEYILSLRPEYRLYLRHHAPWPRYETVLYALP